MAKKRAAKSGKIFVFKVALRDDDEIWRRIALRGDHTLDDLHEAIYEAFDRDDPHLYSFFFLPPGSRSRYLWQDAIQYSDEDAVLEDPEVYRDAAKTRIDALELRAHRKFHYLFDFGDEWWHVVTTEQVNAEVTEGEYPRVLEKHGESPPQY